MAESQRDGWPQRVGLAAVVIVLSVALDQLTKAWATATLKDAGMKSYLGDVFRLEYARNPGAFLSLGGTLPESVRFLIFTVGVGVVLAVLFYLALVKPDLTRVQRVAYFLMVSGGLSNGWDRVFTGGRVTDFMNLGLGSLRTGIFNVADLAIVAGVVMLVLFSPPTKKKEALKAA